jgi:hypothetical protein
MFGNMKHGIWMACVCMALSLILPRTAFSQEDYYDIKAGYYGYDKILANELPSAMSHKGKFLDGVRWKDESGSNCLLLCYDTQADGKRDIYLYQYREVGGKTSLVWDIQDFGSTGCKMTFVLNSLQLLDLDFDGVLEACFMYQNECENNDVAVTKLMLLKDGKKLAIRGKFNLRDNTEIEKQVDPVVADFPAIFKNFMLLQWNEFKRADASYSKSILYHADGYKVMQKEYLEASGGTEFQLLDPNGLPLKMPKEMESKINYANSMHLMPDRKTLCYGSLAGVGMYDPLTKTDVAFVTFLPSTEAVSQLVFSPDRNKIAFTALNPAEYPQNTRIFVLTIDNNSLVKKDKYDGALMYMAASNWVVEAPIFKDNRTLEYVEKVIRDNEVMEGDLKTIVLEGR